MLKEVIRLLNDKENKNNKDTKNSNVSVASDNAKNFSQKQNPNKTGKVVTSNYPNYLKFQDLK